MRKLQIVTAATGLIGILSFLCLFGYFLALHDIYHDYASPKVLYEQARIPPETLPGWTACPLEWRIVRIGFWLMPAFHIMALATFVLHARSRRMANRRFQMDARTAPRR